VNQRPFAFKDCGVESLRRHRSLSLSLSLSLVSVVCCQVEISASGWSLLPSVVCLSVILKPQQWGSPGPLGVSSDEKKKGLEIYKRPVALRVMSRVVLTVSTLHILYRGICISVQKLTKLTNYLTNINVRSVYLDLNLVLPCELYIRYGKYLNRL